MIAPVGHSRQFCFNRRILIQAAVIGCMSLASCEATYGVTRVVELSSAPSMSCVEAAIEGTPGVVSVQTATQNDREHRWYRFGYRGAPDSNVIGGITIELSSSGSAKFFNVSTARIPPVQTQIDATRPVMRQIEQRLAINCQMSEVQTIQEECNGVVCTTIK